MCKSGFYHGKSIEFTATANFYIFHQILTNGVILTKYLLVKTWQRYFTVTVVLWSEIWLRRYNPFCHRLGFWVDQEQHHQIIKICKLNTLAFFFFFTQKLLLSQSKYEANRILPNKKNRKSGMETDHAKCTFWASNHTIKNIP